MRSNLTYLRGSHSFKTGMYYEDTRNSEGKGGVGGGSWSGDYNFGVDTNNPLDTNFAYANALLGNFTTYTETDGFADVRGQRPTRGGLRPGHVEGQAQPDASTTASGSCGIGRGPRSRTRSSVVVRSRSLRAGGSPLLYQPVLVNGAATRAEPGHRRNQAAVYVGGFVPGTGNPYNGMVTQDEWDTYGAGFRVEPGHPARGPRRPGVGHHRRAARPPCTRASGGTTTRS